MVIAAEPGIDDNELVSPSITPPEQITGKPDMRLRATRAISTRRARRSGLAKSKREGCVTGDHRLAAH
jgi:hypothetical protein